MSKPRKALHCVPEIATLIRAAQLRPTVLTTRDEIEDEHDPNKRQKRQRKCEIATDELIRIFYDRKAFKQLSREDQFEIQWFIEGLKRSRDEFPIGKGGRPRNEHERLLIAVKMAELVRTGMEVNAAADQVWKWSNKEFGGPATIESVKDIHRDDDPEWRRLVHIELSRRSYERQVDEDARRAPVRARRRTTAAPLKKRFAKQ